jgi:hypothetical protein
METKVVHLKKEAYDQRIDRRSIFGNPYEMKNRSNAERERVIEEFAKYFFKELKESLLFQSQVHALKGKTLGCWCKPKACHGDVIKEYLDGVDIDG